MNSAAQRVYDFLSQHQQEYGYSPTVKEIRRIVSGGGRCAYEVLDWLVAAGYVKKLPRRMRGVYIPTLPNQFEEAP